MQNWIGDSDWHLLDPLRRGSVFGCCPVRVTSEISELRARWREQGVDNVGIWRVSLATELG
ncbi:MAG: hypothetical protein ACRDTD_20255 [Pseudonocardiaceae bacterium]